MNSGRQLTEVSSALSFSARQQKGEMVCGPYTETPPAPGRDTSPARSPSTGIWHPCRLQSNAVPGTDMPTRPNSSPEMRFLSQMKPYFCSGARTLRCHRYIFVAEFSPQDIAVGERLPLSAPGRLISCQPGKWERGDPRAGPRPGEGEEPRGAELRVGGLNYGLGTAGGLCYQHTILC